MNLVQDDGHDGQLQQRAQVDLHHAHAHLRLPGPRGRLSGRVRPRSIGPRSRAKCLEACKFGTPQVQQQASMRSTSLILGGPRQCAVFIFRKAPCPW